MQDEVDHWLTDWARQRRIMLGIVLDSKIDPRERLGKLRCTLASVRECQIPAFGKAQQQWPEVYKGMALEVHRAYNTMPHVLRLAMDLHYVWREIPAPVKAREVRIPYTEYLANVNAAKGFIRGYIASHKTAPKETA